MPRTDHTHTQWIFCDDTCGLFSGKRCVLCPAWPSVGEEREDGGAEAEGMVRILCADNPARRFQETVFES